MTDRDKPQAPKTLLETLLDSGGVPLARPVRIDTELSGELAARLRAGAPSLAALDPGDWVRLLAAYLDGSIDAAAKRQLEDQLARSPPELSDLVAARAYLDAMASHRKSEPSELVDAAIAGWLDGDADNLRPADVIAFPPAGLESDGSPQILPQASSQASSQVSSPLPPIELFHLSAAASRTGDQLIRCRSESGRWALELIVGGSAQDEREDRGRLRLTVQPDHCATYEGLTARVFVTIGNAERVLAEATIRNGEVDTGISLRGLDLSTREALTVVILGQPAR